MTGSEFRQGGVHGEEIEMDEEQVQKTSRDTEKKNTKKLCRCVK